MPKDLTEKYVREKNELKRWLEAAIADKEKAERKVEGLLKEQYEIDQILGKALGYPEADETIMEKPDGSVVTGEHTEVTLAMEAAKHIRDSDIVRRELLSVLAMSIRRLYRHEGEESALYKQALAMWQKHTKTTDMFRSDIPSVRPQDAD